MMMMNGPGISMMIFLFFLSIYSAIAVEDVSYTPVPVGVLEKELNAAILDAIQNGQHFFTGSAKACGTSIQSLCRHEFDSACTQTDATRCPTASTLKADKKAEKAGLRLTKVFYADGLIPKNDVCAIEMRLIEKYMGKDTLCWNTQKGNPKCITDEKGIVYLRIYEKKQTPHGEL